MRYHHIAVVQAHPVDRPLQTSYIPVFIDLDANEMTPLAPEHEDKEAARLAGVQWAIENGYDE